jgi:tetratricopeptide (TPR) repeat protein
MMITRMTAAILCAAAVYATDLLADDPAELTRRGVELSDQKKFDEAARQFDRAIEIQDKASAKTYHNRGWVRELKGDNPGALKNYEEAIGAIQNSCHPMNGQGIFIIKPAISTKPFRPASSSSRPIQITPR